ncbi:MAG: hypothetical protein NCW75_03945 [Phycisphaera sp.]|nr:MAG: hypothetical protein NCW75_03945 [Phycisphaera sp.]
MIASIDDQVFKVRRGLSANRRDLGGRSPAVFARVYLDAHFALPASRMHTEMFEMVGKATETRGQRIAVAAPRGHAKSTVVSVAYLLWSVLYGHEPHVLLISATREQAKQHLRNVRQELQSNERIREDFPELFPGRGTGKTSPWRSVAHAERHDDPGLGCRSGRARTQAPA